MYDGRDCGTTYTINYEDRDSGVEWIQVLRGALASRGGRPGGAPALLMDGMRINSLAMYVGGGRHLLFTLPFCHPRRRKGVQLACGCR